MVLTYFSSKIHQSAIVSSWPILLYIFGFLVLIIWFLLIMNDKKEIEFATATDINGESSSESPQENSEQNKEEKY